MSRRYRGSLVVWALLLAYASLYPFLPLRPPGMEAVTGFFTAGRYVIRSDIAFNVVAYLPLGIFACLYFRGIGDERRVAILKAAVLSAAFSLAMEVMQLFVPNRHASLVDLASNAAGALLGALCFAEPMYSLATRPLGELRESLVIPGAWGDAGLVLVMLWLLAQLNPALPFFGAGDIGGEARMEIDILRAAAVAMSICGFGLFASALLKPEKGSLRVTLVLLSIAVWLKFAAAPLLLHSHYRAEWVDEARVAGLLLGLLAFVPLRGISRPGRIYLGLGPHPRRRPVLQDLRQLQPGGGAGAPLPLAARADRQLRHAHPFPARAVAVRGRGVPELALGARAPRGRGCRCRQHRRQLMSARILRGRR
jgi:VanZ family protein